MTKDADTAVFHQESTEMGAAWLHQIAPLLGQDDLGTVLCLGRTGRALISALPPQSASGIILLEPDLPMATRLRQKFGDRATVLEHAFSAPGGAAVLHRYALTECDALRPATGLTQLFPSLYSIGSHSVDTISAATLTQQMALDDGKRHVLILGAPGEEMSALSAFDTLGVLDRFEHIITPLPVRPLYEGSSAAPELLSQLEQAGFRLVHEDRSDPDRTLGWLRRDRAWQALCANQDRLRTAQGASQSELAQTLEDAQSALDAARAETTALTRAQEMADKAAAAQAAQIASLQEMLDTTSAKSLNQAKALATKNPTAALEQALLAQQLATYDLADLQSRYSALMAEKDDLEALIAALAQHLETAAADLRPQLQDPDDTA